MAYEACGGPSSLLPLLNKLMIELLLEPASLPENDLALLLRLLLSSAAAGMFSGVLIDARPATLVNLIYPGLLCMVPACLHREE